MQEHARQEPERRPDRTRFPALAAATARLAEAPPVDAVPAVGPESAGPGESDAVRAFGCRAVLVSTDAVLIDAVALIAAAAGIELLVSGSPPGEREEPGTILLLGADQAGALRTAGRGPGTVVLVGHPGATDVMWRAAAAQPGARVAVLPAAGPWLGEYLGELGVRAGTGHVVVFAGTSGGVGTTTLAVLAAAARTLAGDRVLLVDGDALGAGLWPRLKPAVPDGIGWEEVRGSSGRLAPAQLAQILPLSQGTAVLTRTAAGLGRNDLALLPEVLAAARRIFDVVVLDGGRTADLDPGTLALCDVGIAVIGARQGAVPALLPGTGTPHWNAVVLGSLQPGSDPRKLATACGLPLLAYLRRRRDIERAAAEGRLMSVLAHRRLAASLRPLAVHGSAGR
ncbi:hypothetical protein [Paeniglutamicibacter cryotolerans]|uniref:hypothetical protein n=1 Tax=Paeniglutamicibacter cryotolerans TaxID=670079 RepID=UPI00160B260A|nr:hypothetical protein [Paeniglutamicibacter cryotolerans]